MNIISFIMPMRTKNISCGRQAPGRNPQVLGTNFAVFLYNSLQPYLILVYRFTLGLILGKRASNDKLYAALLVLFSRNQSTKHRKIVSSFSNSKRMEETYIIMCSRKGSEK